VRSSSARSSFDLAELRLHGSQVLKCTGDPEVPPPQARLLEGERPSKVAARCLEVTPCRLGRAEHVVQQRLQLAVAVDTMHHRTRVQGPVVCLLEACERVAQQEHEIDGGARGLQIVAGPQGDGVCFLEDALGVCGLAGDVHQAPEAPERFGEDRRIVDCACLLHRGFDEHTRSLGTAAGLEGASPLDGLPQLRDLGRQLGVVGFGQRTHQGLGVGTGFERGEVFDCLNGSTHDVEVCFDEDADERLHGREPPAQTPRSPIEELRRLVPGERRLAVLSAEVEPCSSVGVQRGLDLPGRIGRIGQGGPLDGRPYRSLLLRAPDLFELLCRSLTCRVGGFGPAPPPCGCGPGDDQDPGCGEPSAHPHADARQRCKERIHVGPAPVGLGLEAAANDPKQRPRCLGAVRWLEELAFSLRAREGIEVARRVWTLAVERLVQRHAEGELIGSMIRPATEMLLGCHVGRRAHDRAGLGQVRAERHSACLDPRGRGVEVVVLDLGCPREPEVEHAWAVVVAHEHVVGLEVAVDQLGLVGGSEPAAGADERDDDLDPRPRSLVGPGAQRLSLHELHRDVDLVLERADVVDGHDVGVAQLRHRSGLAEQPLLSLGRVPTGPTPTEHLECCLAVQLGVVADVHHAHAPGTDLLDHDITTDAIARVQVAARRRLAAADVDRGSRSVAGARLGWRGSHTSGRIPARRAGRAQKVSRNRM
jgi:hypothetical protein